MHSPYLFAIFLSLGILAVALAIGAWAYFLQMDGKYAYSFTRPVCVAVLCAVATFSFALVGLLAHGYL